jgi:hypothetical protein
VLKKLSVCDRFLCINIKILAVKEKISIYDDVILNSCKLCISNYSSNAKHCLEKMFDNQDNAEERLHVEEEAKVGNHIIVTLHH